VEEITIPAKRGRLIVQAILVTGVGALFGLFLEWSGIVGRSTLGHLAGQVGLPVVPIVITALAASIAFVIARDSWSHRVQLRADSLSVVDRAGGYSLRYDDIDAAVLVPLGSVAIALRDPRAWLEGLEKAKETRTRTAAVLRDAYGCDILIPARELSIGADAFLDLLAQRGVPVRKGHDRNADPR